MLGQTFKANGNYYRVKNNLLIKQHLQAKEIRIPYYTFGASKAATTFVVCVNNTSKFKVN